VNPGYRGWPGPNDGGSTIWTRVGEVVIAFVVSLRLLLHSSVLIRLPALASTRVAISHPAEVC
jgi:hypothetical protein